MGIKEAELIQFLKQKGGMASFSELDKAGFNKALIKVSLVNENIKRLEKISGRILHRRKFGPKKRNNK